MIKPEHILSRNRGILAADESTNTIGKKLASIALENTDLNRANYRKMLLTAPCLEKYIGGVILFDETFRQSIEAKTVPRFLKSIGISPGIKVDKGLQDMGKGKITTGLEDLEKRLEEYSSMGAEFAKWRAVITIGKDISINECTDKNCRALALYAKSCQANDIVPIIEPETLMDGDHSMEVCAEITSSVLERLILHLEKEAVDFSCLILKVNMVINGSRHQKRSTPEEVATATLSVLKKSWRKGPIVFLSGGQSELKATENLQAINQFNCGYNRVEQQDKRILSFSYGRALQESAMENWNGRKENVKTAQKILLHRAKMNWLASQGKYSKDLEKYG